jgi:FMN phosphatase YigB (HAD superfamily)
MPIRAVVFDLFDTVVDLQTENVAVSEYRGRSLPEVVSRLHAAVDEHASVALDDFLSVMREVDREFRRTRYAKDLEIPSQERFETMLERLGMADPALAEHLVETHMSGLEGHVRGVDHHGEVLQVLGAEVRIGLCSNFSHSPTAMRVLERTGLREYFDAETLHVGDNLAADVAGAARVGIRTAWVTRRVRDPQAALAEFDGPRPDWQIEDLRELPPLLDGAGEG